MDEINPDRGGALSTDSPASGQVSIKVHWALFLGPLAGVVALAAVLITYRPLDDTLIWWVGAVPCLVSCLVSYTLTNIAWRKMKRGEDVRSFFPATTWLALACVFVPTVLFLNGALDHSPVEQHRQVVTRRYITRGRSTSYYVEFSSWRPDRATERASVSPKKYAEFQANGPVIVDVHKGALGIPWMGTIRKTMEDDLR